MREHEDVDSARMYVSKSVLCLLLLEALPRVSQIRLWSWLLLLLQTRVPSCNHVCRQQLRARAVGLRDYGRRHGHLLRQDRHAHREPHGVYGRVWHEPCPARASTSRQHVLRCPVHHADALLVCRVRSQTVVEGWFAGDALSEVRPGLLTEVIHVYTLLQPYMRPRNVKRKAGAKRGTPQLQAARRPLAAAAQAGCRVWDSLARPGPATYR